MVVSFTMEWAKEARFEWDRLPTDVQAGVHRLLTDLMAGYGKRYRALNDDTKALQTSPHLSVPDWNIWLRLKAHYQEDELGPVLFVYSFEELTKTEFDQSLLNIRQHPAY